jgi:hypothetical protein
VRVFDVRNPRRPTEVRTATLSGSLLSARSIGSSLHFLVTDDERNLDLSQWWSHPSVPGESPRAVYLLFERQRVKNEEALAAAPARAFIPSIEETGVIPATGISPTTACTMHVAADASSSYVSVVSLDIAGSAPASRTVIGSPPGPVHVSKSAAYLAVRVGDDSSQIHRFDLARAASRYGGGTGIEGRVLNQFAMDEHEGVLRAAATTGHPPNPGSYTTVSVLRAEGNTLRHVGSLGGIARGEDIRSVRFQGDRGYVVTFKKTDPLFVFDLSKPEKPRVLGELKIPGFSTYMHFMDDKRLLSIGYDADDQGNFAFFTGVLLQIFDVGNPAKPSLLHRTVIGTRGSSSQALTDHLAFNYFQPKGLLSLPLTVCSGDFRREPLTAQFSGLYVYDVSVDRGFRFRQQLGTAARDLDANQARTLCDNWWSSASSSVKRSLIAGDYVLSVSEDAIRIADLRYPARRLPVLDLN